MILGTLAYMAPEQAEGRLRDLDARVDVYSLGAVLYELLTGTAPYRGASDVDTLRQLLVNEPVRPRAVSKHVPRDLEAIALKCLAKDPTGRYATAQHLAEDLRRFLARQPTLARPLGTTRRLWKWARRRPAVATLLAVLCVSAIGLFGIAAAYNARLGAALEDSRRLLYAADMKLAFDSWHADSARTLAERLARYEPNGGRSDVRTFPWYFLSRQRYGDRTDLYRHKDTVYAVAWSPRGDLIASGGVGGLIYIWDVAARKVRKTLDDHRTDVNGVAFSADGTLLASCGDDLTIRIWQIDSDEPPRKLKLVTFKDLNCLVFSPDGRWLAAGGEDQKTRIWDTTTWKLNRMISAADAAVNRIAFSPDSRRLAITHSSGVGAIVDAESGQVLRTLDRREGRASGMGEVAFSRDGRLLAVANFKLQQVDLWDPDTGERLRSLHSNGNWLQALAFSPDDRRLLTGSQDGALRVWDVETLELVHVLLGHDKDVRDVAFSPSGDVVVSAGKDGTVKLWDLAAIEYRQTTVNFAEKVMTLEFLPGQQLLAIEEKFGPLRLMNVVTRDIVFESRGPRQNADWMIAVSPDGKRLAYTTGESREMQLLDVAGWRAQAVLKSQNARFRCAAFSLQGDFIATGDEGGSLVLWDASSLKQLRTCNTGQGNVLALCFLPGGEQIVVAGDKDVRVWDLGARDHGVLLPASDKIWDMAVSPDESLFAASCVDGSVRLWSLPECQPRATLVGHHGWCNGISFSPDGTTLASAGNDGTVRLWDLRTMQEIGAIATKKGYEINSVSFSSDGQTLAAAASADRSGLTLLWSQARPRSNPTQEASSAR